MDNRGLSTKIIAVGIGIMIIIAALVVLIPRGEKEKESIVVYHYWTAGADKQAVSMLSQMFENRTGIKPKMNAFTGYQDKLNLVIDTSPPDVAAHWFNNFYVGYARRGSLSDLTDFWQSEGLNQIFPEKISRLLEVDGKKYGVPLDIHWEGGVVIYNLRVLRAKGLNVPTTWEEFEALLEALKASGVEHPIAMGFKDAWPRDMVFTALLASIGGADFYIGLIRGENRWTDAPVQQAFEIYRQWCEKSYFDPSAPGLDWQEALSTFINGETAIYFMGDWACAALKQIGWKPNVDFIADFLPFKSGVRPIGIPDVEGFVIPSKAKNAQAAKEFLKFITDKNVQISFASIKGSFAPHKDARVEDYADSVQIAMWRKAENWDWALPLMWYYPQTVRNVFGDKMYEIWANPRTVNITQICEAIQAVVGG